jgi:hypothetical protein
VWRGPFLFEQLYTTTTDPDYRPSCVIFTRPLRQILYSLTEEASVEEFVTVGTSVEKQTVDVPKLVAHDLLYKVVYKTMETPALMSEFLCTIAASCNFKVEEGDLINDLLQLLPALYLSCLTLRCMLNASITLIPHEAGRFSKKEFQCLIGKDLVLG